MLGKRLVLALFLFCPLPSYAHWEVLFYFGKSWTLDSDVTLATSPSTRLQLDRVAWEDESFRSPHFFGYRVTYRLDQSPWGLALDFTHAKLFAKPDHIARVSGDRAGSRSDERIPVSQELDHFNLSHGFNFLTLNAIYEWKLTPEAYARAGFGAGITIPHVEATIAGEREDAYQFGGLAVQGLIGISRKFADRFSLFSEYKLGYANLDVRIGEKTRVQTAAWTHQVLVGPQFGF
jgi:hypothetical protein